MIGGNSQIGNSDLHSLAVFGTLLQSDEGKRIAFENLDAGFTATAAGFGEDASAVGGDTARLAVGTLRHLRQSEL